MAPNRIQGTARIDTFFLPLSWLAGSAGSVIRRDVFAVRIGNALHHRSTHRRPLLLFGILKKLAKLLDDRKLKPGVDFQAVVAVSDLLAIGALNLMVERGIRVPTDVAVAGFNDIEEGRLVRPALTSVSLPFYDQGRRSVEMLMADLAHQEVPEHMMLDSRLLVRQSCGCPSESVQLASAEFNLSDAQQGLLGGIPFALFYTFMGIPLAMWADRSSRRNVLAFAVALWSAMTALCGAAVNFLTLFFFRVGVAVGEAGGSPPSHSLISDYFPKSLRGTAFSVFALGVPLGTALGNVVGGWSNDTFGWRATFFIVGVPGLLIALIVRMTVQEPPRGCGTAIRRANRCRRFCMPPGSSQFSMSKYLSSPTIGWPTCAMCARNWWVRPVTGLSESQASRCAAVSTTA